MLEVIDKGFATESHPAPLLFVHGACSSAEIWDDHFPDCFAEKGYRAVALSFRSHCASSWSQPLKSCSIADYVDDVVSRFPDAGLLTTPMLVLGAEDDGMRKFAALTSVSIP